MQAALDSLDGEKSPAATMARRNTRPPARLPKTRTSRKLLPNTTNAAARDRRRMHGTATLARAGEIGEEAFHRIQEELDWSELDAAPAGSFQSLAS